MGAALPLTFPPNPRAESGEIIYKIFFQLGALQPASADEREEVKLNKFASGGKKRGEKVDD